MDMFSKYVCKFLTLDTGIVLEFTKCPYMNYFILETSLQDKYYYHQETGLERQNDLPDILANEDNVQAILSSFHSMQT